MVTVRTYWSLAAAALAKSVLDNYEIDCTLLDENASRYNTGAQFAVPIRLVIGDDEATRAIYILNGDFEKAAELETAKANDQALPAAAATIEKANRNPWELLMIAFYLALPAICLLRTHFPTDVTGRWARYFIARASVAHFLSWLTLFFARVLIVSYFRVRRSSLESRGE